jgi:hypothetical protein
MIGVGRCRLLTERIRGPNIPNVGQLRFNRMLRRSCGCRLAWHIIRRCFVVYRSHGSGTTQTYVDLKREHWPLSRNLLPWVKTQVQWVDGWQMGDPDRMADAFDNVVRQTSNKETKAYIEERFPDFWTDFNRRLDIMRNGIRSRRQRFMDLGASRRPSVLAS